jgi:predicted ester cyclase
MAIPDTHIHPLKTTMPSTKAAIPAAGLRAHYLNYLEELNSHADRAGWRPNLATFMADKVIYNEKVMTRHEIETLVADAVQKLPGLGFDAVTMVIDEESSQVACRLEFISTPNVDFMGVPAGQRFKFYEYVFYDFMDGLVVKVHRVFSAFELLV